MVEQGVKKAKAFGLDLEEMAKAGLHFGHRKSRLHPRMKPYIFGIRKAVHIIDLEETAKKLAEALEFIQGIFKEKKTILFVGTKVQHQELIKELAEKYSFPYVSERWLGGSLTNFGIMRKRVAHLQELKDKINSEGFAKYGKKEQSMLKRELRSLTTKFAGVESLEELPDALFIFNIKKDNLALREAKRMGIPVIAVVDTNVDPSQVDWPIPASDDGIKAARYVLGKVDEAIGRVMGNE